MRSPANLLQEYLSTSPISVVGNIPIFYGSRPSTPIECLTIYDSEGKLDDRSVKLRSQKVRPGIQFISRSQDSDEAYNMLLRILQWTPTVRNWGTRLPSGVKFHLKNFVSTTTIIPMGVEDKTQAFLFSLNYRINLKGF